MFHRVGAAACKADLSNTLAICDVLKYPENKFKSIHIAGTNGKGSTSHMLAAILQAAGYKTGLYTSPHLKDFRERIRINGKMIPRQRIVNFVAEYQNDFEKIAPSFFEWTVGLAFHYFADENIDIAVIETGLGGRLDSTNVIQPLASVITNISWDHANLLGNSLRKIASEKAGIIKKNTPVIIGETQKEVKTVFTQRAKSGNAPIFFADQIYSIHNIRSSMKAPFHSLIDVKSGRTSVIKNLYCGLSGFYQQKNYCTVLAAVDELHRQGFVITMRHIRRGMAKVQLLTGLQGRWQVIGQRPLIIADTGHNEAGIRNIVQQLKHTPHQQLHILFGMVNDKDIDPILNLLPKKAKYYFCAAQLPRALDATILSQKANSHGLKGRVYASVHKAMQAAKKAAGKKDLIFVGGSTFVVAEAL
jgi:dihydrofolate synthase/folylpolyglutamate synthase